MKTPKFEALYNLPYPDKLRALEKDLKPKGEMEVILLENIATALFHASGGNRNPCVTDAIKAFFFYRSQRTAG